MQSFKTYLAYFLLFIVVSYSVDLHAWSHNLDDSAHNDSQQCELCIINHQKDQNNPALQPNLEDYNLILLPIMEQVNVKVISSQTSISSLHFYGQFFNRPPPFTI